MKATKDSGVCTKLDDFARVLSLERLEVNTVVHLYSEQGELIGKIHSAGDCVTLILPRRSMYVFVIHYVSYPVEVRRTAY